MTTTQKHFWLRDEKNNPVGCVTSRREGKEIRWSYSALNPKDKWSWKSGLGIALQRLDGHSPYVHRVVFQTEDALAKVNVKHAIMSTLINSNSATARRAAAKWLTLHLAQEEKVQGEK